jgi:hypothetical protein
MPERDLTVDLIEWDVENAAPGAWGTDSEAHCSVLLRLTDNPVTGLEELRIEIPDDETLMLFVEPRFWIESNALSISGHVPRSGYRTDPEEEWLARPLVDGRPAPWKVEITASGGDTEHLIDTVEPAHLEAVWGRVYKGQWTADDALPYDFWSTGAWREIEAESTLRIRCRGSVRNVDDWEVAKLRRWEVLIEGTTKHRGERTDVVVRLTPSRLIEAARSMGA